MESKWATMGRIMTLSDPLVDSILCVLPYRLRLDHGLPRGLCARDAYPSTRGGVALEPSGVRASSSAAGESTTGAPQREKCPSAIAKVSPCEEVCLRTEALGSEWIPL